MCHDGFDREHLLFEIDGGEQAVLVAAESENVRLGFGIEIGARKRRFNIGHVLPTGGTHHSEEAGQRFTATLVLLCELNDLGFTEHRHILDSHIWE